jgi:hypothetical protein
MSVYIYIVGILLIPLETTSNPYNQRMLGSLTNMNKYKLRMALRLAINVYLFEIYINIRFLTRFLIWQVR